MKRSLLQFVVSAFFTLFSLSAMPAHLNLQKSYTIGVVPQFEQRKLFKIWQPILNELEARTGFSLHLIGSPKIPVFEQKFMAGEYDFAYMNPYHMLKAYVTQGYTPLVKDGSRRLKGVLVVQKDSPIQSLSELEGKILAFPSPNALGASLLMRAELSTLHGISFFPRYVQTHSSVYLNVALGQAVAGGGVLSTLRSQPQNVQDKLRILYETRSVAPHPLTAHARVPEADRLIMKKAWLELAATDTGRMLMGKIPMRDSVPAELEDYTSMQTWGLDAFYVIN